MTTSKQFSPKPVTTGSRIAIAATFLMMASTASSMASASTCVWTGASSGSWSTAGNWTACAGSVPVNGDALQFPEAASNKSTTHNLNTLTTVAGLAFTGTTSGYTLAGNALTLAAGGIANANTSGTNTLTINLLLASNQSFSGNIGAMVLNGSLNLSNQQLGINWPAFGSLVPWKIIGSITGAGGITVSGADSDTGLILGGSNTFSGAVALVSGYTQLDSTNALGVADGTVANGISVGSSATLVIGNNINVGNEALTLAAGEGQNSNGMFQPHGTNNWGGPVQLTGPGTSSFNGGAGSALAFSGPITGAGGFDLGGAANTVYRFSNPGNAFDGVVATYAPFGAVVQLSADNVIPDTAVIYLKGGSTFDLNGKDDTVAALRCTATDKVIIPMGSQLTVGDDIGDTTCAGVISGAFSNVPFTVLTKVGSKSLTLSGTNTYPGEVDVLGGGLEVTGELIPNPATAIYVSSGQGAKLFGTGTVGNVVTAGIIHGGSASTSGTLTTDKLTFNGVGILSARLTSAASYDRIKATNVVISPDASMNITLGYVPTPGTSFSLIENLGGVVQGQFNGLPEGAPITINGTTFVLSYAGGDGNDVTLTADGGVSPPSIVYAPPTGTAPILSASGIGSIAATATNFAPSSTVSISGCAVTPSSPAFPANAFTVVNPTFASPNGSIGIACAPQASATSGTLSCNEALVAIVAPTVRSWPITCPAAVVVGVAPTAALAASSVGLINGVGSVGVNVLTSGVAVGSLDLNCSIPPGAANFQITSGSQRLINAPAILGNNAPAIGLSCVEQATVQSSILSCAQTANPGPNPAPLTAIVTCRGVTPPPPVVPSLPVPTISLSGAFLLIVAMIALVANFARKARLVRKKS